MGLFDFLNNKKNDSSKKESKENNVEKSDFFLSMQKYSEYIKLFMNMQLQGNYAPISAYENNDGEIVGFLYTVGDDNSYVLSADMAILKMEERFEQLLKQNKIVSYTIFYHSQFNNDKNHKIANIDEELKAISITYNFSNHHKGTIGLPYVFDKDKINYGEFVEFTSNENNDILKANLFEGKNYFEDKIEITAPSFENESGIIVKKANTLSLSNTWGGVFGFETYRTEEGSKILHEYFAFALTKEPKLKRDNLSISEVEFDDVNFKAITHQGEPKTILPVVKTEYQLDFETKEIVEWENIDNLEAIVSGRGRDTFGLWYFATDYAENRAIYLTQKKLNINLSGIVFVLDIHNNDTSNSEVKYSKDFTMYMPSNDLPNYGCFDFIGELESFKESYLLNDKSSKGYLLNVRLITNHDVKDFFTIDMYVAKENMRFSELHVGMKLTGMFQLQGSIAS